MGITSAELAGLLVMLVVAIDLVCVKAILKFIIKTRFFHISMLFLGLYGVLLSAIWGAHELIFVVIFLKLFISSIIAFAIIYLLRRDLARLDVVGERDVTFVFFDMFLAACFLQAFTVILSFLYPDIRDFFNGIVAQRGNIDVDHPFRFRGLHDSGGFNLSVVLGVASFYGIYSAAILQRKWSVIRFISCATIIFSLTLVGRTGLMIGIFGLILLVFFRPFKIINLRSVILIVCVFFFAILFVEFFPERFEFFDGSVFGYAFEFFVNYEMRGEFGTESSDDLKTMLFVPQGFHLLFGNGSFDAMNVGVERSDSGYMKLLLASGLFGFVFFYAQLCGIIFWLVKKITSADIEKMFFLFLLIALALAELKGPVFIQNDTSRLFLLVIMIFLIKDMRIGATDAELVARL